MAQLKTGTALVVGGGSGIGEACAQALAAERDVVVADLAPPEDGPGAGHVDSVRLDVRDGAATAESIAAVAAARPDLDAVVFAAGTARVTPLLEIEQREWDLVRSVNLDGAFHVLRAGARALGRKGGSIVLISSIDARAPVPGLAHYCASKAAVESLARSAAVELGGAGIRVNAVAPGVVRTPLMASQLGDREIASAFVERTPLGAIASPAEVADVVAFLVSEAARWITGATIPVDGGMRLRGHPDLQAKSNTKEG